MLEAVVEECVRQGHQVTVICAAGGYAGSGKNVGHRTSNIERRREESSSGASATGAGESLSLQNQKSEIHNHQSSIPSSPDNRPPTTDPPLARPVDISALGGHVGGPGGPALPGVTILRIGATRFGRGTFVGKLLDYASYYFVGGWRLLTLDPRPDRIVALTTPPYLSILARAVSKLRGADHAHWVMDLYPDVMVAHGMLGEGGWKHRLLAGIARWGFGGRRCASVLTLGPDMAERVGRHCQESTAKAQRSRRDAEEVNIEHRTSDIERRRGERDRRARPLGASGLESEGDVEGEDSEARHSCPTPMGESGTRPAVTPYQACSNYEPSTLNPQLSTVSWVPLWGGGRLNVEHRTSNIEHRREEAPADSSNDNQSVISSSSPDSQPSTLNPQLSSLRAKRGWAEDELVVMYSGNMGLGHRFGEILAVAGGARVSSPAESMEGESAVREEPIPSSPGTSFAAHRPSESGDSRSGEVASSATPNQQSTINNQQSTISPSTPQLSPTRFVFYGGGKRRGEIEAFIAAHPEAFVELHDYAPAEELSAHLTSADIHLVSLEPEWTGTMVPSKLQGIFAVGRPVVFVGSRESSIGRWVGESGGGWVVAPGDVDGLRAALEEARNPQTRMARGDAAGVFARENFDKTTNAARVVEIFTR